MRSVVARFWGGHPFEEKYLNIAHEQLHVLYLDALKNTRKKTEDDVEYTNAVLKNLYNSMDNTSRLNALISNPEVYKIFAEQEELIKHREEITDEQFMEEFNYMLDAGIIPQEINITLPGDIQEEKPDDELVIENLKTFDVSLLEELKEDEE